jgi:hypothetical protein
VCSDGQNGGGRSALSYCNGCGCPFMALATMVLVEDENVERDSYLCPHCGAFRAGWTN